MWNLIRRTSGISGSERWKVLGVLVALLVTGCNYTFQAGSGLPPHIQTLAVTPFENDTDRFEISQELHQLLLDELPRTLRGEDGWGGVCGGTCPRKRCANTPSKPVPTDQRLAEIAPK